MTITNTVCFDLCFLDCVQPKSGCSSGTSMLHYKSQACVCSHGNKNSINSSCSSEHKRKDKPSPKDRQREPLSLFQPFPHLLVSERLKHNINVQLMLCELTPALPETRSQVLLVLKSHPWTHQYSCVGSSVHALCCFASGLPSKSRKPTQPKKEPGMGKFPGATLDL